MRTNTRRRHKIELIQDVLAPNLSLIFRILIESLRHLRLRLVFVLIRNISNIKKVPAVQGCRQPAPYVNPFAPNQSGPESPTLAGPLWQSDTQLGIVRAD